MCSLENDSLHEYYETIFNMAVKNRNLYDMLTASLYENKSGLRERMEHVTRIYKLKKKSKLVAAGIIQPDGSMRYIITNGKESHVFKLTMDGIYRIYIENNMVDNVHVEGAYSTH